ncbi:hypothetical protein GC175_21835 [bacterium]|nr:hypothetical protein [bacterium]
MTGKARIYNSNAIDVGYEARRCIHAAECVRGLPTVFDTEQSPWIQPANAEADAIVAVVLRCPTGALHFTRKDGGEAEAIPAVNQITVTADGPLYVRGDVHVALEHGALHDTRMALCRCGQSANRPFCDNSHRAAGFTDAGFPDARLPGQLAEMDGEAVAGPLTVTPAAQGPLLLQGNFELINAEGETFFQGERAALCRCGGSVNKPFCDGTHKTINFEG